jgi:hypothetical protein
LFLVHEVSGRDRARTIENNNHIKRSSAVAIVRGSQGSSRGSGGTSRISKGATTG